MYSLLVFGSQKVIKTVLRKQNLNCGLNGHGYYFLQGKRQLLS